MLQETIEIRRAAAEDFDKLAILNRELIEDEKASKRDDGSRTQGAIYPAGESRKLDSRPLQPERGDCGLRDPSFGARQCRAERATRLFCGNSISAANTDVRGLAAGLSNYSFGLVSTTNQGFFSKCWRPMLAARPSGLAPGLSPTALLWSVSLKRRPPNRLRCWEINLRGRIVLYWMRREARGMEITHIVIR